MTATALLARLDALGVSVKADGGVLRIRPASAIPADLLADLRAHKAELVELLTSPANGGMPASHKTVETETRHLDGYLRAALLRPVSWTDAAAHPSIGCFCSCCKGRRWWGDERGWRCWQCHPPSGLTYVEFREVRT